MFICHSHKFIFTRVPKNASTSVAAFLIRKFGNPETDSWTSIGDAKINNNRVPKRILESYKKQYQFIHLTPKTMFKEGLLKWEEFCDYDRIAIVREPFDRQVSLYKFLKRQKNLSSEEFRELFKKGHHNTDINNMTKQIEYCWTPDENMRYEGLWCYDYLQDHIMEFMRKKGKLFDVNEIPSYKKSKQTFNPYRENPDILQAVENYFLRDIQLYDNVKKLAEAKYG